SVAAKNYRALRRRADARGSRGGARVTVEATRCARAARVARGARRAGRFDAGGACGAEAGGESDAVRDRRRARGSRGDGAGRGGDIAAPGSGCEVSEGAGVEVVRAAAEAAQHPGIYGRTRRGERSLGSPVGGVWSHVSARG